MTEKRFTIEVGDRDCYLANMLIVIVGVLFYWFTQQLHFLGLCLGAILFLNFGLWLDTIGKRRSG